MLEDFTQEEKQRINILYGTDFEGITPADAQLIARFEAAKAREDEEMQAKTAAIQAECELKLQNAQEEHAQAMSNLAELQARALARLERFDNGK